jgi:anti-anti-sigma regulatory factor
MAIGFQILTHRNGGSLHLKLRGDFDGSSAHELLNTIKRFEGSVGRIFIHTAELKDIHPFGRGVFHNHLSEINPETSLLFTGEHSSDFAK